MPKLTNAKITWIVRSKARGKSSGLIAMAQRVTSRRVNQLYQAFKSTGRIPMLNPDRRPRKELNDAEMRIIKDAYDKTRLSACLLKHYIKYHYRLSINHNRIHAYLLELCVAKEDPAKKKKRTRCRYERKHSCSLLHGDWIEWRGRYAVGFSDDASRKMLSLMEFDEPTGENTIAAFKETEKVAKGYNACILAVNTDRGSQFYSNTWKKKGVKGVSEFERYLESRSIRHIPSRRNNPQTNGKFERWVREYKKHRDRFGSAKEFMDWYNDRMHGALNLEWAETPNQAFVRKLRPEALLGLFLKNVMGEDQ